MRIYIIYRERAFIYIQYGRSGSRVEARRMIDKTEESGVGGIHRRLYIPIDVYIQRQSGRKKELKELSQTNRAHRISTNFQSIHVACKYIYIYIYCDVYIVDRCTYRNAVCIKSQSLYIDRYTFIRPFSVDFTSISSYFCADFNTNTIYIRYYVYI